MFLSWLSLLACGAGAGPAAVGFDHLVDFGHQADSLLQGDDDLLVVVDVFVGEYPTAAVLQSLLPDLVPANMEVPDIFGDVRESFGGIDPGRIDAVFRITLCNFAAALAHVLRDGLARRQASTSQTATTCTVCRPTPITPP